MAVRPALRFPEKRVKRAAKELVESDLVGSVVEARILCVHPFGVGVELTAQGAYGHINPPRVTDDRFTVEATAKHIGEVRKALVLTADSGRQSKLTLRPSQIPSD